MSARNLKQFFDTCKWSRDSKYDELTIAIRYLIDFESALIAMI